MMEKYDGVRVVWNGKRLTYAKSKIIIDVPPELQLPSIPFEGELWYTDNLQSFLHHYRMGHNNRERCVQFIRTPKDKRDWSDVKIMIFDAPQATDKPYDQRLNFLQQRTYARQSNYGPQKDPLSSKGNAVTGNFPWRTKDPFVGHNLTYNFHLTLT
jgi:hypothetical protein